MCHKVSRISLGIVRQCFCRGHLIVLVASISKEMIELRSLEIKPAGVSDDSVKHKRQG